MNRFEKLSQKFLDYCCTQKQLSKHTIKAYRIDLRQYTVITDSTNIPSKTTLESYSAYLHQHYKPKSVKRKMATLHTYCNWLVNESLIEKSPFNQINLHFREPKALPRYVSLENINRLLSVVYANTKDTALSEYELFIRWRDTAIIELLFATGMRVSELCNLHFEQLDLETGIVRIFGKGRKERIVTIANIKALESLRTYLLFRPKVKNNSFFLNRYNRQLSDNSVRTILTKHTKQAGIKQKITPHMIRHSVATLLLEQGMDIRYIQQILGHSSIKTTQIYTHISTPRQAHLLATLHPRNQIHPEK